jgi:23S rRNA (cytosine1962-C5)-methyltransferase
VTVTARAAQRVEAGHVWIYASDVEDAGSAQPGDPVTVLGPRGRTIGTAHYSSTSQIALRFFSPAVVELDTGFLTARLQAAFAHRRRMVSGTTAYRLVFSEADRLPGLIVDLYGSTIVVQTLTQGMERFKDQVAELLMDLLRPDGIWERNDAPVRAREGLAPINRALRGQPASNVVVTMNGVEFAADLAAGQKTGVYLDQRENYVAAARFARGLALDCFTSTGGFALHLARRCESVEAVDSGAAALAAAETNAARNHLTNIRFREADVFDLLTRYRSAGRRFDTVVLDPPAFAKTKGSLEGAIRGYKEINLRALQLLEPGGTLVTCSCSHHMSEALLLEAVAAAALDARKTLRILDRRAQAADHPILLTVPETLYLKCLILEVL